MVKISKKTQKTKKLVKSAGPVKKKLVKQKKIPKVEIDEEEELEEPQKITTGGKVTIKLLKQWQEDIEKDKSNKTIIACIQAFHGALTHISPDEENVSIYKVEGSAVFNGIIQLCVVHLGPALRRYLGINDAAKQPPHKCKRFIKIKRALKGYFMDLLKLLEHVSSENIQSVVLKHFHYMSPFLVSYPNITKSILKRLISIWGKAKEGVRVVAFLCILRITNNQRVKFLDAVLKSMYMTYVKNSKFVSVSSLPSLNFMRRSLVEMFALDPNFSYQHVFLYIRQLAIHLRNAITVNKKENIQAVYNWQFVNSLRLWGALLAHTTNKSQLHQLIYPLVQICLGTIKLVPTAQYFPLRFHIVQILIELSRDADVFIPILPFLLEVLNTYDFNKKHQKVSMKPINLTCVLRASKSQMSENGYKDAIIDTIYGQLLEYLSNNSHSIGFSDLSLVATIQLKQFVKQCTNANYNRKMKQVLDKINENNEFIYIERSRMNFNMTDFKQIEGFETQIKNKGTPITSFYIKWSELKKSKQQVPEDSGEVEMVIKKKKDKKTKSKSTEIAEKENDNEEEMQSDVEDEGDQVVEADELFSDDEEDDLEDEVENGDEDEESSDMSDDD